MVFQWPKSKFILGRSLPMEADVRTSFAQSPGLTTDWYAFRRSRLECTGRLCTRYRADPGDHLQVTLTANIRILLVASQLLQVGEKRESYYYNLRCNARQCGGWQRNRLKTWIYAIRLVRLRLLQIQAQVVPRHVRTDPGLYASGISTAWLFGERAGASSSGSKCPVWIRGGGSKHFVFEVSVAQLANRCNGAENQDQKDWKRE